MKALRLSLALAAFACTEDRSVSGPSKPSQFQLVGNVASGTTADATVSAPTVAYWKFDEGSGTAAADSSGNGNHAALLGGSSWTPGLRGSAVLLDGVSGQLSVPNSPSLNPSGAFSMAAWVFPKSAMSDFRALLVKNYTYFLYASVSGYCGNGSVTAGFSTNVEDVFNTVCTATPLSVNAWTHVAGTYDGTALRLYINGALVASAPASGVVSSSTSTLRIGASQFGEYFNGLIDEAMVYDGALSASEVQAFSSAVPVASVTVIPALVSVAVGVAQQLTATTRDASGNVLGGRVVTWSNSDTAVATVSSSGLVTGKAIGAATITATSEGKSGGAAITVRDVPVASVDVWPASAAIQAGQTMQLTGTPTDAAGNPLPGRAVSWASTAPAVAIVSSSGLVTGVAAGAATISATSEGVQGTSAVTVTSAMEGTYYVAPTGSDANPGTAAAPFRTIQKAASLVNPGDVVIVEDGVWNASGPYSIVEITRGGAPGKLVTFRSRNRWGAKLDGQGGVAKIGFYFTNNVGYVRIEGFDIFGMANTAGSAAGVELYGGGHNSQIVGNHIHDIGRICTENTRGLDGIYTVQRNVTIEQNVIHDIGRFAPGEQGCSYSAEYRAYQSNDHGIYVASGDSVLIRNNIFYNHRRGWAVQLYPGPVSNVQVLNNTFAFGNPYKDYSHIILFSISVSTIANNIFYDPAGGQAIDLTYLSGTVIVRNNLTSGSVMTRGIALFGATLLANRLNTDPLLVNPPGDFHLRPGSPAIDAGLSLPQVLTDFDARPRPRGAGYDLGAYEF
jgi:uncharacterized protein YjdB